MRSISLTLAALALGIPLAAAASPDMSDANNCSLKTLAGSYMWTGSGWTVVAGTWAPKAIVEQLKFDGAGTVTVVHATIADRFGDGQIAELPASTSGTYAVDSGCAFKVQFVPGFPNFNVVLSPDGKFGKFIQTDVNNAFHGDFVRLSH